MSDLPNRPANAPAQGPSRSDDSPTPVSPELRALRAPHEADAKVGQKIPDTDFLGEFTAANARAMKGAADAAAITERISSLNRFFDQLPDSQPRYRVLELIGRGGMGAVFKAEQRSPVKRLVALKLVKPGFDSRDVIARFESERQALARMDHGSVAKVLDAGADDKGRPYFVMEYVPGIAITEFADQNKLSIKARLELFMDVCAAIAHAHSKAIIHRDIKASNVLAYFAEGKAVVKVIDFGIAKALAGDRLTDLTMNTRMGQPLGTYESMSPEQAEGSPDIDTRTDVYSLGVLLYELLAGAAPFDRAVFAKAADQEIRRIIREVEPPRPSMRLTSMGDAGTKIALARQSPLDALANELRTELEWIPLMAMRKSRERRYATPLDMAADIRRYLEHRPLRAGPESRWYIVRKYIRRHRVAIAAVLTIFVSLVGGLTLSTYLLVFAIRAEADATRAGTIATHALEAIDNAMAFGGDYEAERDDLMSARRLHIHALDEQRMHNQASSAVLAGLVEIESAEGGEIPLLGAFGEDGGIPAFRGHTSHANNIAVLPGGRRALTAGTDGQLYLWDLLTGRAIAHQHPPDTDKLAYVDVSHDGKFAVTGGSDGRIRFWETDTLEPQSIVLETTKKSEVFMVAISPDDNRVVAGTKSGELWLWNSSDHWTQRRQLRPTGQSIPAIAFLPKDSRFAVVGDESGELSLWDLQEEKAVWIVPDQHHKKQLNCIIFSLDGATAATAGFDGDVVLWNVHGTGATTTLTRKRVLSGIAQKQLWRVAFSPNGKLIATGIDVGLVPVYDVQTGQCVRVFRGNRRQPTGVAFVDDTLLLSTGGDDMLTADHSLLSALRLWDVSDRSLLFSAAAQGRTTKITVDDSGHVNIRTAAGESMDAYIGANGRLQNEPANANDSLSTLPAAYADALRHVTWAKGGNTFQTKLEKDQAGQAQELEGTGVGRLKLFAMPNNHLNLFAPVEDNASNSSTLVPLRSLGGHNARIVAAAMSPNGRFIASIDEQGRAMAWDLLRPVFFRDIEPRLAASRGSNENQSPSEQELEYLKNWFMFRGRTDLAARAK